MEDTWPLSPSRPLGRTGRSSVSHNACSDKSRHADWPHKEVPSIRSDAIPVPRHTDETTPHNGGNGYKTHRPNTEQQDTRTIPPTIGWDPWRGSRWRDLPGWWSTTTPMIGVVALSSMKWPDEQRPGAATYYRYDTPRNLETMTKTMTDAVLHMTADELSPWLQCHHGHHSSTTSEPAATWPHPDEHQKTA
jgi:hypothetical protein